MARKQITDLTPTDIVEDIDYLHIKDGADGIDKQLLFSDFELPTTSFVRQTVESLGDVAFDDVVPVSRGGTGGVIAAQARSNLELGSVSVRNQGIANSSDIPDRGQADLRYLRRSNNLSDLDSVSTARSNLGVLTLAEIQGRFLQQANDLSDLGSISAARDNLGLSNTATITSTSVGQSLLTSSTKEATRNYLDLGVNDNVEFNSVTASFTGNGSSLTNLNASALSTGTVPTARLPSQLLSTNDFSYLRQNNGYTYLGRSGLILQWGSTTVGGDSNAVVTLPEPFTTTCLQAVATLGSTFDARDDAGVAAFNLTSTSITVRNGASLSKTVRWFAIGY